MCYSASVIYETYMKHIVNVFFPGGCLVVVSYNQCKYVSDVFKRSELGSDDEVLKKILKVLNLTPRLLHITFLSGAIGNPSVYFSPYVLLLYKGNVIL